MEVNLLKIIQYVNTGEVFSGGIETTLNSGAIGSCVVITAYDPLEHIGAMAHVMLPGRSSRKENCVTTRYAEDALEELLNQLFKRGSKKENIEICLAGGANVLRRDKDTIGKDNLVSVENLLRSKNFEIKSKAIGGFERRTVVLDIYNGCIYYTQGDSKQKILWQTGIKY